MRMLVRTLFSRTALVFAGMMILCSSLAVAQVLKGSISGTVVDPQGAVVSGAQVKATQVDTGAVYSSTSDASGLFRFSLIPTGTYKIEISAQGFKTAVQSSVPVSAGADQGLGTVKLAVGGASETLEVTATAPLVETSQAQITNTFSGAILHQFAGIQENQGLDNLALFVPGVVSVRDQGFSNSNGGVGFSSNGLRGRNNDQEIDGQNNNDNSVAGPSLFLADPEFVQQYVLINNNFGAEYGRNAGSVVNIITKSGTNSWHGSLYGNENNSVLNSLTVGQKDGSAQLTQPPRANDEFGGFTIGGPWIKNKLFIFGGFDQEIVSTGTLFQSGALTPTPAGLATLAGCFPTGPSADAVSALTHFGPYGISAGNPQPGNLTVLPASAANGCAGVEAGTVSRILPTPVHIFNWVTREDLQLGSDTLSGRYIFARNNFFNLDDNGAAGYVVNVPALSQALLISETHNFSSRIVNEARVSYDRLNVQFGGNTIGTEPTTANILQGVTNVAFVDPNALGFGVNTAFPQGRVVNTWQAQDNWNYVLGRHALKAGVNWTYQQSPNTFLPFVNGGYLFQDLSGLLANTPVQASIGEGSTELGLKEYDTFAYIGDDWKIGQNLTLNLGLTWSYFGQPLNLLNSLDMQRETGANPLWNPALPLSVRVSPKVPAYKNAYGPSFGFAYSPQWGGFLTGRGKTVIRGGYRLAYDPGFYNIYLNNANGAPHTLTATLFPSAANALNLPAVPTGPNVRSSLANVVPIGTLDPRTLSETQVSNNFRPDQVQTWSFGIERELSKHSAFEVRYSGNHANNLFQTIDGNPFIADLATNFPNLVPAGLTPCPASQAFNPVAIGRVNCNEGIVAVRSNSGISDYHALQAELRANNLFNQLTLRSGYTFSKTTDNVSEIFSTFSGGTTVAVPQNQLDFKNGEHSLSGLDTPNAWTLSFVEELPFFKAQHGFMGRVLGGWGLSGDYILASGQPYTPFELFLANTTAAGDFYDNGFLSAFNGGLGSARPFLGSTSAPSNTVGIFCGDAIGAAGCATAGLSANQLISLNALNANGSTVAVTNSQVRFIANTGIAQSVFGTPFGNVPRNYLRDGISNTANFTISKRIKLSERASFEFHTTFLNVFNHPNFVGVVPFIENAGVPTFGQPFATPRQDIDPGNGATDSIPGSNIAAGRRIYFGGTIRF